jgi:3-mercaptopyruvate sulfurtransferase SseA
LALLGRHDVVVYDASLNEWAADESRPLVVTAE